MAKTKNKPTTQPAGWEQTKHPPGMSPEDFFDANDLVDPEDVASAPVEVRREGASIEPPEPPAPKKAPARQTAEILTQEELEERRAARKQNEVAARMFLEGRGVVDKTKITPSPREQFEAQKAATNGGTAGAQPRAMRVLDDFPFARPGGGGVTTIRKGKVISDRDYDLVALARMGCKLEPYEYTKAIR